MTCVSSEIYENSVNWAGDTMTQALNAQVLTQFFNEMQLDTGDIRQNYHHFNQWLNQQSIEQLNVLNAQATAHFYKKGITFIVYNDEYGTERVIPFDIIPRIIEKKEWSIMEAGCKQRILALNAFLHDIYHQQDIIKAGIIPAEQVIAHDSFQPWMLNVDLPGKVYAHISGVDLIRHNDGNYYVLEDNLRTPSGVSYMLESRAISQQLMPDLFAKQNIASVDNYSSLLKQTLTETAGIENPTIVVLTPGRYNSAYYEHAFLAREMNAPLVSGSDLYVEKDEVFLKSITGRIKVDVIYRRLDDPFLDPLAFRPDSMLGVPGLMAAYRAGKVMIANAPGTGVADDKSIYPYVEKMIEFYLGEKPILNNVPTWQCRKKDDLSYVLSHLSELVVKEAQGSGGYGMLIGTQATTAEIEDFRKRIIANPKGYIAQPTLALSVCPTMANDGISPRHIDLRPFVLSSPEQIRITAGGLTRVALSEGSLVVNSSQGGGIKDTWIIDTKSQDAKETSLNSAGINHTNLAVSTLSQDTLAVDEIMVQTPVLAGGHA